VSLVYFIQAGRESRPVKIGRAKNVARRLTALQTCCPDELTVLFSIACSEYHPISASQLEAKLHRVFADLRIRPDGEWFAWHDDIASAIEALRWPYRNERGEVDVQRIEFVRSHSHDVWVFNPEMDVVQ
jgi:hypothetical protein